jgi:hypothetical protein
MIECALCGFIAELPPNSLQTDPFVLAADLRQKIRDHDCIGLRLERERRRERVRIADALRDAGRHHGGVVQAAMIAVADTIGGIKEDS